MVLVDQEDVQMTKKLKAAALPALTRQDVEQKIGRIARLQAGLASINAEADASLAHLNQMIAEERRPIETELTDELDGVLRWAEANRAELCASGGKTVKFPTGEISWRRDPASVSISKKKGMADKIIEALKNAKLKRFLRIKLEIDKEAILKEQDAVAGIDGLSIKQGESIYLKPYQTAIEAVELSRKVS
jgi:phage host-nuclease inhibitor protein Gam